jgi:hypothetical protein
MKSEDTDTKEKVSPILREEILKAVRFQIRENNPPETKKTYERLLKKYSSEDALTLIGGALVTEIYWILKNEEVFNEERYTKELRALE